MGKAEGKLSFFHSSILSIVDDVSVKAGKRLSNLFHYIISIIIVGGPLVAILPLVERQRQGRLFLRSLYQP